MTKIILTETDSTTLGEEIGAYILTNENLYRYVRNRIKNSEFEPDEKKEIGEDIFFELSAIGFRRNNIFSGKNSRYVKKINKPEHYREIKERVGMGLEYLNSGSLNNLFLENFRRNLEETELNLNQRKNQELSERLKEESNLRISQIQRRTLEHLTSITSKEENHTPKNFDKYQIIETVSSVQSDIEVNYLSRKISKIFSEYNSGIDIRTSVEMEEILDPSDYILENLSEILLFGEYKEKFNTTDFFKYYDEKWN